MNAATITTPTTTTDRQRDLVRQLLARDETRDAQEVARLEAAILRRLQENEDRISRSLRRGRHKDPTGDAAAAKADRERNARRGGGR